MRAQDYDRLKIAASDEYEHLRAVAREILHEDPEAAKYYTDSAPSHTGWFMNWGSSQELYELNAVEHENQVHEDPPNAQELLNEEEEAQGPMVQMLLDEKAHKAAVKASYQSNVKTIYYHLEEIIKKILAHRDKWTNKYNGDLSIIAKGLLKHKNNAKNRMKQYIAAKGMKGAANKLAALKSKSWNKANAKLKAKQQDAAKERKALKGLYIKGLRQKEGEICMIRKIQCMVAKFNGEAALQKKYCGACKENSSTALTTNKE
jgi:hypothetical protein